MKSIRGRAKARLRSAAGADEAHAEVEALRATVAEQRTRIGDLEREVARVSPQVAALEARIETLREKVEGTPAASPGSRSADGSVGSQDPESFREEFKRQQKQVRARLAAATRFEERLRKLEEERAHS
ncbi:MAG: hypothetical protein ACRDPS_10375 [Nocardioides sp.]|uniref:hypothetical protein n=1 Tax=Nocardioides sp. TaxID=35761 RepID=UPI003D6AA639